MVDNEEPFDHAYVFRQILSGFVREFGHPKKSVEQQYRDGFGHAPIIASFIQFTRYYEKRKRRVASFATQISVAEAERQAKAVLDAYRRMGTRSAIKPERAAELIREVMPAVRCHCKGKPSARRAFGKKVPVAPLSPTRPDYLAMLEGNHFDI